MAASHQLGPESCGEVSWVAAEAVDTQLYYSDLLIMLLLAGVVGHLRAVDQCKGAKWSCIVHFL